MLCYSNYCKKNSITVLIYLSAGDFTTMQKSFIFVNRNFLGLKILFSTSDYYEYD